MTDYWVGKYGCPLCDGKPPHWHNMGPILNGKYYCPNGPEHIWREPSFWRKRRKCRYCVYKERKPK